MHSSLCYKRNKLWVGKLWLAISNNRGTWWRRGSYMCKGAYRDEGAYVIRALIRIGALSRKRLL